MAAAVSFVGAETLCTATLCTASEVLMLYSMHELRQKNSVLEKMLGARFLLVSPPAMLLPFLSDSGQRLGLEGYLASAEEQAVTDTQIVQEKRKVMLLERLTPLAPAA